MTMRRKDADEVADAAREKRQRGYVIVWMAAALFVLIGAAAFAVDLVHAYVVGQETQNAADAAALAGAAQLPVGCAHAQASAKSIADQNLAGSGLNNYAPTYTCSSANEMTVDIKTKFDTWFAGAIGFPKLTVHRRGIAEYDAPVAMGSPANHIGDVPNGSCVDLGMSAGPPDPCVSDPGALQNLFVQINGPDTRKNNGNAYTSNYCSDTATDGCSGVGLGQNLDRNNSGDPLGGEYFDINVQVPGPLIVAVYDGGFVPTGSQYGSWCDPSTNALTDPEVTTLVPPRYYLNSQYCAGDIADYGYADDHGDPNGYQDNLMDTNYQVLDPNGNPVCPVTTVPGVYVPNGGKIGDQLGGTAHTSALPYFEHWVKLCPAVSANATTPDKPYRLHVWSTKGQGTNAFSVLALVGNSPFGVNVYAREHLPLYARNPSLSSTTFYVARVLPSNLDRKLDLNFFDLGDNPSSNYALSAVDVDVGTKNIIQWPGGPQCTYTPPPGFSVFSPQAPWGNLVPAGPGCKITTNSSWLSQWVTVEITIPGNANGTGYNCDPSSQANCWITMTMTPHAPATSMQDNTSWDASMNDVPVRLTG
jgi:hypothetical protein